MFKQFIWRCVLCSALLAVLGAARIVDGEGASDIAATIEQLRYALQQLPRSQEQATPAAKLIAVVEEVVVPHIDVALAGQMIMGRHWRDAHSTQRENFIDAYRVLLLRLYAQHALDYLDADVEFLSAHMSEDGQQQRVRTRVHRAGRPDVTVDYQMRKRDGKWRVFDAVVNGVSVVITLRQTVSEDISRYGIDAVIARTRDKLDAARPALD
ncbi:unnamed protein product [Phaeothamnion confervicola]